MPGKIQEIKGRVEEAVGKATSNSKLERAGKIDKAAGKAKQAVTKVKKTLVQGINKATKIAK